MPSLIRLAGVLVALGLATASPVRAQVVISQVFGGGGNTGAPYRNDYVELFNRGASPVSLNGLSVQYASATGTGNFASNPVAALSGSLQPGQYYLLQLAGGASGVALPTPDATGTVNMSATSGKVVLVSGTTGLACNGGSTTCSAAQLALILDLVGYGGANFFDGAGAAPTLSNSTAGLRQNSGCTDTNNNGADFVSAAPSPRSTASPLATCQSPTNPTGTGAATPPTVLAGQTSLLTVAVKPGTNPTSTALSVTVNLVPIGGPTAQAFVDDGTNGDLTAGDLVFSWRTTVDPTTSAGSKTLAATIADAQSRTGAASLALDVVLGCTVTHTIAEIQGSAAASPLPPATVVTTRGVVYGLRSNGFFAQMATGDGDETTSDGIFVFTGGAPPAAAAVGHEVCVTGPVLEFVPPSDPSQPPLTEISGPTSVFVLSSDHPLPEPTPITAEMTSGLDTVDRLERLEGMRVSVASLTVVAPTGGSVNGPGATGSSNGVFYGVVAGVPRPFREAGIDVNDPLPDGAPCCVPRFDGNPERLRVDSDAQPSAATLDVTTGTTVTGLVGPLDYAFRTYTVLPEPGSASVSALATFTPAPAPRGDEVTVASLNLQGFYNTTNDPGGDTVLTEEAFENRLRKASLTIRDVLRLPDVLAVVEVENLSTLQALAARVNADVTGLGGLDPGYVAYLEEGNDPGGIDVGFLVKSARISTLNVTQVGKDATFTNPVTGRQDLLNDRPPLVLDARAVRPAGDAFDFTVIVNHLRSLIDIDDPTAGPRVRAKRQAQAEFLASLIQDRQLADPQVRLVAVGDFNAFEVNDGFADVMGTIVGTPAPADEVVLAGPDLVSPDLFNLLAWLESREQYSYVFDGNAQVLDHAIANTRLASWVSRFHYGRSNADFPEVFRSDATRPERLSDHDGSVTYLALGTPRLSGRVIGQGPDHVDVQVTNVGGGNAFGAQIDQIRVRTLAGTGAVTLAGPALPLDLPALAPGGRTTVRLRLNVPSGVTRFSVTENGRILDAGGTAYRFSMGQAVVPVVP
jgi:hypothetical protein